MKEEQVSYMMLFCALLLVKNSRATLEQSLQVVPLAGRAKSLAGELANQISIPSQRLAAWAGPVPNGVAFAAQQSFGE
ncbi:MAG: hypothetical protein IH846_13680 [Acidobacteria bacterium]|nr:hypothetical protein [Acidobacteriota bacterium]